MSPRPRSLGLLLVSVVACRDPTEVRVEITTDLACSDLTSTAITVGRPGKVDLPAPSTETHACATDGIGDIVVVPGANDAFGLRVVAAVNIDPAVCRPPDYAPPLAAAPTGPAIRGCIVARRSLGFVAHTPLMLPIVLRGSCIGKPCTATSTCVNGTCVDAEIDDPALCAGPSGCDEGTLAGSGGGGAAGSAGSGGTAGVGGGAAGPCWTRAFGGPNSGETSHAVAVDGSGDVLVAGDLDGTVAFGGAAGDVTTTGQGDAFAAKLDPSGTAVWARRLGGPTADTGRAIAVDSSGDVYVGGAFTGALGGTPLTTLGASGFVFKLAASDGSPVWSSMVGAGEPNEEITVDGLSVDPVSGRIVATCSSLAPSYSSYVVRSFDPAGNVVAGKTFASGAPRGPLRGAIHPSGDVVVAGVISHAVVLDSGVTVGVDGSNSLLVARMDAAAEFVWAAAFVEARSSVSILASAVAVDAAGDVVVVGATPTSLQVGNTEVAPKGLDALVIKIDGASGAPVWAKVFGDDEVQSATSVVARGTGLVVGGRFSGTVDTLKATGDNDAFLFGLDPAGKITWRRQGESTVRASLDGLALDGAGRLVVAGGVTGTVDLGCGVVGTDAAHDDILVAALQPPP